MVSESLDESTDPQLLQRCADFFIDNSQFDRAVDLLAAAKRVRFSIFNILFYSVRLCFNLRNVLVAETSIATSGKLVQILQKS